MVVRRRTDTPTDTFESSTVQALRRLEYDVSYERWAYDISVMGVSLTIAVGGTSAVSTFVQPVTLQRKFILDGYVFPSTGAGSPVNYRVAHALYRANFGKPVGPPALSLMPDTISERKVLTGANTREVFNLRSSKSTTIPRGLYYLATIIMSGSGTITYSRTAGIIYYGKGFSYTPTHPLDFHNRMEYAALVPKTSSPVGLCVAILSPEGKELWS